MFTYEVYFLEVSLECFHPLKRGFYKQWKILYWIRSRSPLTSILLTLGFIRLKEPYTYDVVSGVRCFETRTTLNPVDGPMYTLFDLSMSLTSLGSTQYIGLVVIKDRPPLERVKFTMSNSISVDKWWFSWWFVNSFTEDTYFQSSLLFII